MVHLRATTALEPIITGAALAQRQVEVGERLITMAFSASRQAIATEGARLAHDGAQALAEFQAFAELVEKP